MHHSESCRTDAAFPFIDKEDQLRRSPSKDQEAYQFLWRSSFDGDALVHIARKGALIQLRSRRLSLSSLCRGEPQAAKALSPKDWEQLQQALTSSNFWSLDMVDDRLGFDGAQWSIEGRRGDICHSVQRWSPGGPIFSLGLAFFALAGAPLAEIKLY